MCSTVTEYSYRLQLPSAFFVVLLDSLIKEPLLTLKLLDENVMLMHCAPLDVKPNFASTGSALRLTVVCCMVENACHNNK